MPFACPDCGEDATVTNSGAHRVTVVKKDLPKLLDTDYSYLPRARVCSKCGFRFHTIETELMAWIEYEKISTSATRDAALQFLDKLVSSSSSWEDLVLAFSESRRGGNNSR